MLLYPSTHLTCSYCDLEEVEKLGALLLDRLSLASAIRYPSKNSNVKTIGLKNRMLVALGFLDTTGTVAPASSTSTSSNTSTAAGTGAGAGAGASTDATKTRPGSVPALLLPTATIEQYSFGAVEDILNDFVNHCKNAWSTASSMLSADEPEETLRKRSIQIAQTLLPADEAAEIARLLIRAFDRANAFHCERAQCGAECDFHVERCPSDGCSKDYSRKWAADHAAVCPHKIVPCHRFCGENLKRKDMPVHLHDLCGLRIVQCPLFEFGCKTGRFQLFFFFLVLRLLLFLLL
jgi:hypothetical protein